MKNFIIALVLLTIIGGIYYNKEKITGSLNTVQTTKNDTYPYDNFNFPEDQKIKEKILKKYPKIDLASEKYWKLFKKEKEPLLMEKAKIEANKEYIKKEAKLYHFDFEKLYKLTVSANYEYLKYKTFNLRNYYFIYFNKIKKEYPNLDTKSRKFDKLVSDTLYANFSTVLFVGGKKKNNARNKLRNAEKEYEPRMFKIMRAETKRKKKERQAMLVENTKKNNRKMLEDGIKNTKFLLNTFSERYITREQP